MAQQRQEVSMTQHGQEALHVPAGSGSLHGTASSIREPKALSENYHFCHSQQVVKIGEIFTLGENLGWD